MKVLFDRLTSLIGITALFPLLIVIACLIRFKMPNGPVIFSQKRVGKNGKLFTMYKFRTMTVTHNGNSISVKGENRITALGAWLRKYKLDELPELWNVLKGDMSLVGPRPDVPGYADKLEGDDRKMLLLKPGITGPASLKYRNEEEILAKQADPVRYNDEVIFPDKVRINLSYLEKQSLWLDLKIILCTVLGKDLEE